MTGPRKDGAPKTDSRQPAPRTRRAYSRPQLIEYGAVGKLTQAGGVTTRDFGNMRRMCL